MNTAEFRKFNPEFQHRLRVSKDFSAEVPTGVKVSIWMKDVFGAKGDRWIVQPLASPYHVVVWFKNEADLTWATLRWT
jgi:hypothetical protein